jgi:3-(3-hydroxy-phenyl)propionate hydroxylase
MLLPGETSDQALADGYVENLLKPYRDIDLKDIARKILYTFHARIAETWRVDRVFLAGDAAHLTPPFAGQGMNAGLRDAANISWKIATVLNGGATDAVLNSYQDERYDPAWSMILLAVAMGDVVMPIKPEQVAFREQLVKSMQPFPAVKDYLLKMKFKPKPRYDRGMFIGLDAPVYEASLVGEMIPQPKIKLDGRSGLLDEFLGSGFALIAQDKSGIDVMNSLLNECYLGLPLAKLALPYKSGVRSKQR